MWLEVGRLKVTLSFLAWILTGIGNAEQVIGSGKVELIFGHVDFEEPARYLWGRAKGWKYTLRSDWPSLEIFPPLNYSNLQHELNYNVCIIKLHFLLVSPSLK